MQKFLAITSIILLTSCATQEPVVIEYNTPNTLTTINSQNPKRQTSKNDDIKEQPLIVLQEQDTIKENDYNEEQKYAEYPSGQSQHIANKESTESGYLKIPEAVEQSDNEPIIAPNLVKDDETFYSTASKSTNTKIVYHEVQEGETLDKIAAEYHQTPKQIAELNELTPPYHLQEFQMLKINLTPEILNKVNKELGQESKYGAKDATDKTQVNNSLANSSTIEEQAALINQNSSSGKTTAKYSLPVNGKITTRFGQKTSNGVSKGIEIVAPLGDNVYAIAGGMVVYAGHDNKFGNLIIVKVEHNLYSAYAYLQDILVSKGDIVSGRQIIGHVGKTGQTKTPQLYFAMKQDKENIDPLRYIKVD